MFSYEGNKLRLRALDSDHAPQPTNTDKLAPFALHEWAEYRVVAAPDSAERFSVWVNRQPIDRDRDGPFWPFSFQNQIGKSSIQVALDDRPLPPLTVEVLSNKFPTPSKHLAFYQALLDDLIEQNVRLPFTFHAFTGHAVEEATQPPSALFVYHFLRQYDSALGAALETVLRAPHRLLHEEEAIVPAAQARTVGPTVIDWVLAHPDEWKRAPHMAVAEHLGGYAPARVWQPLAEETLDTPPNRFVRYFINELDQWLAHPTLVNHREQLTYARGITERALHDPLFDNVGAMHRFPVESQVLLKRDGYRELLQLWQLFHLARQPFFGPLQEAIDSRDIATMYEFWCFLSLVDRISEVLGAEPHLKLEITDERGVLPVRTSAHFQGTRYQLVYNRGFGQPNSYSVLLRPDFTLLHQDRIALVFDAKFRFDLSTLELADDALENEQQETVARVAKKADLYKMHTYRDALKAGAAIALYPGDETVFYSAVTQKKRTISLDELLRSQESAGVGALPFCPAA